MTTCSHEGAPSLIDVARRSHVSTATVSRILSGKRKKNDATQLAVRKAAKELNYLGNHAARALRRDQSDTIGLIVPQISNPFFAALAEELENVVNAAGQEMLICASHMEPDIERERITSLLERNVNGIIIIPCDERQSVEACRMVGQVPLVQVDQRVDMEDCDWVGIDDRQAMRLIVEHLVDRGAQSLAFIGSSTNNSSARDRLEGFNEQCARHRLPTRSEWTLLKDYSVEWGREATRSIISSSRRSSISMPDAIVCANDLIALGVLDALRADHRSVPGEVMVTGFDDTLFGQLSEPALTTIAQPVARIAQEAVRLITLSRNASPRTYSQIALMPNLVARDSA
ncbi:MAG: LacI family DNA-binding transcriptional regulator [Bifidobacterium sp.]|uniref:LacI family DNA-binding transcriptional regulator n=1 Tax=Bifidobacterium fermentum TaxID=3059035 RepID=A0AB39U9Q1_9BIFI